MPSEQVALGVYHSAQAAPRRKRPSPHRIWGILKLSDGQAKDRIRARIIAGGSTMPLKGLLFVALVTSSLSHVANAQVTRQDVPGVTNFATVKATVACSGAIQPESASELKRMGFAAVINLRPAEEPGANVAAEAAAAKAAGLHYFHLPFSNSAPDPAVVDRFLQVISEHANQPALIHCASGNRAAAMWMIKRVQLDHWDVERAAEEAAALGLKNSALKQFALDYIAAHRN
jgi:uncharacterized protein (TIGR01244 family)